MDMGNLIAILVGIGTLICNVIASYMSNQKKGALIEYRLQQVETKLEEHNNYAKMYADTHESIMVMQKDIEHIKEKMEA